MDIRKRLRKWLLNRPRKRSAFAGAKHENVLSSWIFKATKIEDIQKAELPTLRERARDLSRNNFIVRSFGNQFDINVFGCGIKLQNKAIRPNGELSEVRNRIIEENWLEFTENCDVTGRGGLNECDSLIGRCLWRDGEAFVMRQRGWQGNRFRYGVKVVDPCLVDDQFSRDLANGRRINLGVEEDAMGVPVAYHLKNPRTEVSRDHTRIEARDLLHVFIQDQPGQTRGIPWIAASMVSAKHLDGLMEAGVVNARSKALTMGFLQDQPGEVADDLEGDDTGADGESIWNMEAGVIRDIGAKSFQGFDPGFPDAAFGDFTKTVAKAVTSSMPGSYASITGDIENASWSALRNDEMRARTSWAVVQKWYIRQIRKVIFEDWLTQALLAGQIVIPGNKGTTFTLSDFDALNRPRWFPPIYPAADDLKRQNANKLRLEMKTASRAEVIAEEGKDISEVDAAIAADPSFDPEPSTNPES